MVLAKIAIRDACSFSSHVDPERRRPIPVPRVSAYRLKHLANVYALEAAVTVPIDDILRQAGVDPVELAEANSKVDLKNEAKVAERCCEMLSDKTFTARVGLAAKGADTLVAYLTRASETVGQALALVQRYYALEDRDVEFEAHAGETGPVIALRSGTLATNKTPRYQEMLLFGLYRRMGQIAGPDFGPLSLLIQSSDQEHCERLSELAQCPVTGNQMQYAIQLPENGLSYPISTSDQALLNHLKKHGDERLKEQSDAIRSLSARVSTLIRSQLPGRILSGDEVASALGLTRRTLTRRLASEGTGYKTLVETARSDLAKRLILAGESIAQVAFLLDFADQAAFSVAFKRWTGTTPARFRKQNL